VELLGYTSVQAIEPPMPADEDLNCWGLAQGADYTVLFFVPFNETLDDGKKIWNSFVLANEAVHVAHDLWQDP